MGELLDWCGGGSATHLHKPLEGRLYLEPWNGFQPKQRRDKTKLVKQGMMQELLTGRIRLV